MRRGNLLLQVVLSSISALALSCCDGGDSKCSATNPCVDGYKCNKNGDCIEGTGLKIDTSILPDAYVDDPYNAPLQASGGIPPYQWSVQSSLAWLGVEETGADIWALTGTPDASTLSAGVTVTLGLSDDSLDGGNLAPKDLTLIVHECVEDRKRNCYVSQAGICISGDQICTNGTWASCDASGGPSTDIDHCGADCTPCGTSADKCVGGLCACGDGSPCTGNLICCFGICVDDTECGTCGDGVKDEWEDCDKLDVGGETCLTLNYYGGNLHCLDDCSFDLTECEAAGWCGDLKINGQEDCDGTELGTSTCETYGYLPGELSCASDCKYDATDCCGDGTTGTNEDCDDQNQEPWDGCNDCSISEFLVNTTVSQDQSGSAVAIGANGNYIVTWNSGDPNILDFDIFGQLFDSSGNPVGNEFQVNTFSQGYQAHSSTAMSGTGRFLVVWYSEGAAGSDNGVSGQIFNPSGTPVGTEFLVNTYTAGTQQRASVAMNEQGNFVVVWSSSSQDGSGTGIFGQRFNADGTREGSEFQVNTHTDLDQDEPSVAIDGLGNFVVVWCSNDQDGSGWGVFGQRYDADGTKIGPEFQVNTYISDDQKSPHITMNSDGRHVVVWHSYGQDGSDGGAYGQIFGTDGTPVGSEFQINTYTENWQVPSSVAIDAAGNFIAIWICDGQGGSVFGQRFEANGTPIGVEFRINTYLADMIQQPAAAMDTQGRFVVTWDAGEPGLFDVYAQRFSAQGEPRGRQAW